MFRVSASLCWLASSSALLVSRSPACVRPRTGISPLACLDEPLQAAEPRLSLLDTVLDREGSEDLDEAGAPADAVVDMLSEDELQYGDIDDELVTLEAQPYSSARVPRRPKQARPKQARPKQARASEDEEEAAELAALLRELDELEMPSYAAPPSRQPPKARTDSRARGGAGRRGAVPQNATPAAAASKGKGGDAVGRASSRRARGAAVQRGAPAFGAPPPDREPLKASPPAAASVRAAASQALPPPYTANEAEGFESAPVSANAQLVTLIPTRVMIFIDGSWLYYSLFGRGKRCPIVQQYGAGWSSTHHIDLSALPQLVSDHISAELLRAQPRWQRAVEVVQLGRRRV